ncbi:MAG: VanZ family protein [Burkholderiales bacterium]
MFEKYTLRWTSMWLAIAWLLVASVVVSSLVRMGIDVPGGQTDKLVHVIAYAVLMCWFSQIYAELRARAFIAIAICLMGVILEFAQGYTGYRTFDYFDMAANSVGIAAGWLIAPPRTANVLLFIESWT